MMSTAVSTSRAGNRPVKDKTSKSATPTQVKADTPSSKMNQATAEQMRIAQIISDQSNDDDVEFRKKVKQVMDLTNKSQEAAEIALHDCQCDTEKAINMLLEGGDQQGEWRESGKKKKKDNKALKEQMTNHEEEKVDSKPEQISDKDKPERQDGPGNRSKTRRFDSRPPRLARGRGKERGDFSRGNRENDTEGKENGFGTFDKDRDFGESRGRGRGRGRGGRGGGVGRGGRGGRFEQSKDRNFRSQRFEKGPQIDTWTNETAENADKEPGPWESIDDWNDDSWTGNLSETKVFTASAVQESQADGPPSPMPESTSTMGQKLDLGALLQKPSESQEPTYISQYNQQATESIKNSIGIGSTSRQGLSQFGASPLANHMPASSLSGNQSTSAVDAFVSSFAQQNTSFSQGSTGYNQESSVFSQTGSAYDQGQTRSVFSQGSSVFSQDFSPSPTYSSGQTMSSSIDPVDSSQQSVLPQRPKPQKSKVPPPSKIPSTAVEMPEMPGQNRKRLDVQFGIDFGFDSPGTLFGDNGSSGLNHIQQSNKSNESVISSGRMTASPSTVADVEDSSRNKIFSPYTTPTKKDQSARNQKASPSDQIPFQAPDRKSSPMIAVASNPLSAGSIPISNADGSNLSSFSQSAPAGFGSAYSSQSAGNLSNSTGIPKSTSLTNGTGLSNSSNLQGSKGLSSGYSHGSSNQPGSYQYQTGSNQYQASQSQFQQSGQNQFQSGSNQFGSGQNQYQNYGQSNSSYQSSYSGTGGSSYRGGSQQNQSNLYQTPVTNSYQSHSNQNSLYRSTGNSPPTSNFQGQTNASYHSSRDTTAQPGSYSGSSRDSQSASFPANASPSGTFSGAPSNNRDSSQSGSFQTSVTQPGSSFQRDVQSSLATPSTQTPSSFTTQAYGASSSLQNNLPSNLQTSPLQGAGKLSESLSKMTVQKDSSLDSRQSPTFESSSSTTPSVSTSQAAGTISTSSSTATISATTTVNSSKVTTGPTTSSKTTPSLPPGVQLLSHQYIPSMPPIYGLQQPMYAGYDEMLLQHRLPPLHNFNYDMSSFGVPTTLPGRDQTTVGNISYSGSENKVGRVEAQSPVPSTQQGSQSTTHQQHFINLPYGYYYPGVLPGTAPAGFQYPTMFPVPPVTQTAHAGTSANSQFKATYGTHTYGTNKAGYEDLNQGTDFTKSTYGSQTQNKVSAVPGTVASVPGAGDLTGTGYGKSHTQAFDKNSAFHAGTPPPFNLPLASGTQSGPLGASTAPFHVGAPFMNVPMMAHQPGMLHSGLQQDSSSGTSRGSHGHTQQSSSQTKSGVGKGYSNSWGYQ